MKAATVVSLACRRLAHGWGKQYRIWKTALDWTVWLYILIPWLLIAAGTYRDWWLETPDWLARAPDAWAVLPPLLLALSGKLRTLLEEADILFLRQRPVWIRGLLGCGAAYSFLKHAAAAALLFGWLSVWLLHGIGLSVGAIVPWAVFTAGCMTLMAAAKHQIRAVWQGWRRYAMLALGAGAMAAVYAAPVLAFLAGPDAGWMPACAIAAVVAAAGAVLLRLRSRGTFPHDVQAEREARMAGGGLLLSGVEERKPLLRLRKPLLFRRSRRLLRGSEAAAVLAEMRIKTFLRRGGTVRLWLQCFSLSSAAVLLTPPWLSPILAAVLPLLGVLWLRDQWKAWIDEPFFALFRWETADTRKANARSRFWLLAPGIVWLALLSGWAVGGWIGALAGLPVGLAYGWGLHKVLAGLQV